MIVSTAKAIRLTGRSKAQFYRDMKDGRVSRTTQADGKPGFEITELLRAYGQLKSDSAPDETAGEISERQNETLRDSLIFEERIRSLEAQLRLRDEMQSQFMERLRDKEAIIEGLKNQVLLIEHVSLFPENNETVPQKTTFFGRLFAKR